MKALDKPFPWDSAVECCWWQLTESWQETCSWGACWILLWQPFSVGWRIRVKAEKIMESVQAWPECSPDLITSIRMTVAFPTLWAARGRKMSVAYRSLAVIHWQLRRKWSLMYHPYQRIYEDVMLSAIDKKIVYEIFSQRLGEFNFCMTEQGFSFQLYTNQWIIIILGLVWLCKGIKHLIFDSYTYLRGILSSFRNDVVVHDIEIGPDLLKFNMEVMEQNRNWKENALCSGIKAFRISGLE